MLLVEYLDGVFLSPLSFVLARFCVAGLFETELHVALVGLLFMPFSGFFFVSAKSVAVPQCEFRGPFEVTAVGKEKGKGTPRPASGQFFGSRPGQQLFRGQSSVWRFFCFDQGGSLLCGRSAVHAHLTSGRAFDPRWTCV